MTKSYSEYIAEASFSRFWNHFYKNQRPVAFISAFRARDEQGVAFSKADNRKRNKRLGSDLQRLGYGYVRIIGVSSEKHNGETIRTPEESFMVIGNAQDKKGTRFAKDLLALARKYDQDSVLFKLPQHDNGILMFTDGTKSAIQHKWHPERISQYYSIWKGRPFTFEKVHKDPKNISEARMRTTLEQRLETRLRTELPESVVNEIEEYQDVHSPYSFVDAWEDICDGDRFTESEFV